MLRHGTHISQLRLLIVCLLGALKQTLVTLDNNKLAVMNRDKTVVEFVQAIRRLRDTTHIFVVASIVQVQ